MSYFICLISYAERHIYTLFQTVWTASIKVLRVLVIIFEQQNHLSKLIIINHPNFFIINISKLNTEEIKLLQ